MLATYNFWFAPGRLPKTGFTVSARYRRASNPMRRYWYGSGCGVKAQAMGRVTRVNNLQNEFSRRKSRKSPCYTTFPRWRRTIFGVHQADSPKQFLRFRPVIAEHPILCEDIDMGRDAELRRVRWAGSLSSIICKTNVFTKKMRKSPTFPRVHQAGSPKNFTKNAFEWLETWWNLGVGRRKKYVSSKFWRGIRFRAQKLKIPSIFRRNYFFGKKTSFHIFIFSWPKITKSTCHFWASSDKRPEIRGALGLNPQNPGTFGLIPSKVAFSFFRFHQTF